MINNLLDKYWLKCLWAFCLWAMLLVALPAQAQNPPRIEDSSTVVNGVDTAAAKRIKPLASDTVKRHSPKKAALLSMALPGLGQAYNKKYWKIPIVYAGFAGLTTGIILTGKNYRMFREGYRTLANDTGVTSVSINGRSYNVTQAADFKNYHKRNMDICIIFTAVWYVLNIVDATVDAHLFEFDVSDKLTLHVEPTYQYQAAGMGYVGLKLNLKL